MISVIGLDGLSMPYLEKLLRYTIVPNIGSLMSSGWVGRLLAFPPMTPPSWTSIMSGVDPGVHGIYDFYYGDNESTSDRFLVSARYLMHPRIHEMMDFLGHSSIVINPMPNYPLYPLKNSIQISNAFFTPRIVYNPKSAARYASRLSLQENAEDLSKAMRLGVKYVSEYIDLVEDLLGDYSPDLFWITLPYPDHYLHKAGDPSILVDRLYEDEEKLFMLIDELVGFLSKRSNLTIIVSDHGFSTYKHLLYVNTYLYTKNLVVPEATSKTATTGKSKLMLSITRHRRLRKIARILYRLIAKRRMKEQVKPLIVDRGKSIAYLTSHTSFGVRVNKEEYIDEVIRVLRSLTGIRNVYRRDGLFRGPSLGLLPEVYIEPDFDNGYFIGDEKIWTTIIGKAIGEFVLNHHPYGVFIASRSKAISTIDSVVPNYFVANLILALQGLPVSIYARGVRLVEKALGGKRVEKTDLYVKRWKLLRRIYSLDKRKG